ncbi:Ail/Lom family outer membrane beta-barrel protein [Escherichia coli]|nr:Ail/Lom family outer membrane beta-barrel protein [Escherichia coli]
MAVKISGVLKDGTGKPVENGSGDWRTDGFIVGVGYKF